jgi:hypothetical protein
MSTLAHHDTPPCPKCKAQAVVPISGIAESSAPVAYLVCASCGHEWEETDPKVTERAWRAQEAWDRKYRAEAEQLKKREKRAK